MTLPRQKLVSVDDTPYYHITTRCVRRTFLCGTDNQSGRSFEHRRQWIEDRIRLLSSIFAVDICAYAVMSNHVHIVVKISLNESESWNNNDVMHRWACLFKGPPVFQKACAGERLSEFEQTFLASLLATYRERLTSLSWFMKCLSEPIARMANREDGCTGHFWESRIKYQALLTEEALLSCMAYVDLNPIRAGMAQTPEDSNHTSIKERIQPCFSIESALQDLPEPLAFRQARTPIKPLTQFEANDVNEHLTGILFGLKDYLELVDITGRMLLGDKRGAIPLHLPPILDRLHINWSTWLEQTTHFEALYEKRFRGRRRSEKHCA